MDLIISFENWLKALTGGEATFYTTLATGIFTFIGWFIRWFFKRKAAAKMQPDSPAVASPLSTAPTISIETVKAETGGAAFGSFQGEFTQIINGAPLSAKEAEEREQHYLNLVMKECAGMEWLSLVQQQDEQSSVIGLDAVYTALMTNSFEELEPSRELSHEDKRRYSALEMLDREAKLVLTGAPGSGKSTLVNFIALCLAGECLGHGKCNIKTLTRPLPDDGGKPQEREQPWRQGALIPLRIILRDFGVSNCFPAPGETGKAAHLMNFIKSVLAGKDCAGYFPVLEQRLREGKVLLLLDGLDEVAEAGDRRERLIQCIKSFDASHDNNRLLVTARPYAYQQKNWKIQGFQDTTLADFGPGQIRLFVGQWYAGRPEFDEASALTRAEALKRTLFAYPALYELARRPLLLTLMAFLHSNRHELPERRADLYERLLELLIEKWEKARFQVKDVDEARVRQQSSLAEYLQVGIDAIRRVLERLAFAAHAGQSERAGTADIAAQALSHQLFLLASCKANSRNPPVNPNEILEYLRDRVGILYKRGGDSDDNAVYTFPHRSFQEYLAATYFYREEKAFFECYPKVKADVWQDVAAYLGSTDPDRWREVVVLAGSINSLSKPGPVWDLVNSLAPKPVNAETMTLAQAWGLRLAGEILADNLDRHELNLTRQRIMERIQQSLPHLLRSSVLNAAERVAAGLHLAKIGDPRQEVLDVDAMPFCPVPAGPFFLGSSDNEPEDLFGDKRYGAVSHNLDYAYAIARYPVTVAQFRQYVEASGNQPENTNWALGPANTPVVSVSQREAIAFCDWLSRRWREQGWLPQGWRVDLPSEPEWEKAARGGEKIPVSEISPLKPSGIIQALSESRDLTGNPSAKRIFPWGDEDSDLAERMNFDMKIGFISPVGCYPTGGSPYGCEDLCGNVWEWTRSQYQVYPYPEAKELRRQRESRAANAPCVLRGGSFLDSPWFARCASRLNFNPVDRDNNLGFRVVLSPLPLTDDASGR